MYLLIKPSRFRPKAIIACPYLSASDSSRGVALFAEQRMHSGTQRRWFPLTLTSMTRTPNLILTSRKNSIRMAKVSRTSASTCMYNMIIAAN